MDVGTVPPIIFVIDDDQGLLRLLTKFLVRTGYKAFSASSGQEAIQWFKSHRADLLLLDLHLPDISRDQLLAQLVEVHHVPFIVITGHGDERIAVEMMKKGAMDYLVKDGNFLEYVPTVVGRVLKQIQSENELKRLEQEILEISEREQRRIGQDLHDGLGQQLTGIELLSEVLEQDLNKKSKPAAEQAAKISKHVREAIAQTRSIARGLIPVELDSRGLMSALQELCTNTQALSKNIQCNFICETPVSIEDHVVATHLYRIAQEALNNAIKHAKARNIEIVLMKTEDQIVLSIKNDGRDFPKNDNMKQGMGLRIMNFRAASIGATLEIQHSPGIKTQVICTLSN